MSPWASRVLVQPKRLTVVTSSSRRTATAGATCATTARTCRRSTTRRSTSGSAAFDNPYPDLAGADGGRNWDSERRLKELEADGVVAEVIFPNTIPPFFPGGVAGPPASGRQRR